MQSQLGAKKLKTLALIRSGVQGPSHLAKKLNEPLSTVHDRLQRMKKRGLIDQSPYLAHTTTITWLGLAMVRDAVLLERNGEFEVGTVTAMVGNDGEVFQL